MLVLWDRALTTREHVRSGDDNLSIDQLLVKLGALTVLVGGGNQGVALVLEPLADAELVLGGSEKLGNLCVEAMLAAVLVNVRGVASV